MSSNPISRLVLPTLTLTPDIMTLSPARRRRLLRGIAALRKLASAEIERLLDFLGRTEFDSDFEPVGDMEPSLGYLGSHSENPYSLYFGRDDDREEDDDSGIADRDALHLMDDKEPSLGWTMDGRLGEPGGICGQTFAVDIEGPDDDLEWSIGPQELEAD